MTLQNEAVKGPVDMLSIGPEIVTATAPEPEVKRFKCNLCGAEVMSNQSLKRHIKGHETKRLKELALKQAGGDSTATLSNIAIQLQQGQPPPTGTPFPTQTMQPPSLNTQTTNTLITQPLPSDQSPNPPMPSTNPPSVPAPPMAPSLLPPSSHSPSHVLQPQTLQQQQQLQQQLQQAQQQLRGQFTVLEPPSPSTADADRSHRRSSSPSVKTDASLLLHPTSQNSMNHRHQHVLKSDAPLSSASSHPLSQSHDDEDDDVNALRRHLREAANDQRRNHHNPLEDDEDLGGGVGIEPGEITGPLTSASTASRGSAGGGLLLGVDEGGGCGGGGGSDVESERSAVTGAASSGERQSRVHYCGPWKKTFYNSYNLKRHVKAVHEGIAPGATKPAIRFKRKKDDETSSNDETQSQVTFQPQLGTYGCERDDDDRG